MFKGFGERLVEECENLDPVTLNRSRMNLIEKPYKRYISWIGASILASLSSFQSKWISKSEFEEHGVSIIHKKSMFY